MYKNILVNIYIESNIPHLFQIRKYSVGAVPSFHSCILMIGMGNKFSQDSPTQVRPPFTVKASEPDTHNEGLFSSLKSALGGSSNPPALKPTEPTEITSSGDSLSQTPSKPNESPIAEDPRTITSSLPSFPGTWNELHKVKGMSVKNIDKHLVII